MKHLLKLQTGCYMGSNLRSLQGNGFAICETAYLSQVSEDWHVHENLLVCLPLTGGNHEKRKSEDIEVLPGKMLLYRPNQIHRNIHTQFPSRNINLELTSSWMTRHHLAEMTFEQAMHNVSLKLQLFKMYKELIQNDTQAITSIEMLLLHALNNLRSLSRNKPLWIHQLYELLNDQWNRNFSLLELSSHIGIHPVNISRYFPTYFNSTLSEYMRRLKIEQAISLMSKSDVSLTEIAMYCGFADQSHFTRAFKAQTGFLPNTYRCLSKG